MEYILMLLVAVLVGLIWMRKRPFSKGNIYYWGVLGAITAYQAVFVPYRVFRVLYDLGHLIG